MWFIDLDEQRYTVVRTSYSSSGTQTVETPFGDFLLNYLYLAGGAQRPPDATLHSIQYRATVSPPTSQRFTRLRPPHLLYADDLVLQKTAD